MFRYDPFEQMDRLFDRTRRSMWNGIEPFGAGYSDPFESGMQTHRDHGQGASSHLNVERTDEGYLVMVDLPGFETDDLDLRFEDGVLTVRGETGTTDDDEGVRHSRTRRVYEQVSVPAVVVEDEIAASYHNGVLEVRLPVKDEDEDDHDGYRIDVE